MDIINTIMAVGRSAVELSLFTPLPVMVVMLPIMRLAEAAGLLDALTRLLAPVLRPFGLTKLSFIALLQVSFMSFVEDAQSILAIINRDGSQAFRIVTGSIPIMALPLSIIAAVRAVGGLDGLNWLLSPLLDGLGIDPRLIAPTLSKYLGGGVAALGAMADLQAAGEIDARFVNRAAGWLFHPLDLPGIAILVTAGSRVAKLWVVACFGASIGIVARTLIGLIAVARAGWHSPWRRFASG